MTVSAGATQATEPRHATDPRHLEAIVSEDRRSFRLTRVGSRRSRLVIACLGVGLIVLGAVLAVTGLVVIVSPNSVGTGVGVAWLIAGLFISWMAVHLHHRAPAVYLTDTQLRTRDELGFTWRMPRTDVVSIDIGTAMLPKRAVANRVPFARKTDGSRMWLTPLAGDAVSEPVAPAQLDVVRALRAALHVGGQDTPSAAGAGTASPPPRDSWRHGPRASAAIYAAFVLVFELGLWIWLTSSLIGQGVHLDDLRHARGSTVATLAIDHNVADCYRGCTYKAVGSYVAPWSGRTISNVHVVPNYDNRTAGLVQVIVSPEHAREALQVNYTGKGDIVFGAVVGVALSVIPLVLIGLLVRRVHRRLRVRNAIAAMAGGALPTGRFRGILRGPGINPMIGVCRLELTPDSLIEVEKLIGGDNRWTVPLTDVTGVSYDVNAVIDAAPSATWQTLRFTTSAGTYTLTCDPAYLPLLREAFDRHAQKAST